MLQAGPLCFYTTLFHPFSLTAQYGHSGRKIQKKEWYKTATLVILFQIVLSCYLKMWTLMTWQLEPNSLSNPQGTKKLQSQLKLYL